MNSLKDILVNTGAIAGFAGIVGLAVLAMLYFSQARDVRRLREWAGREPERAAEVELRAQQIASQAIAQAYESMALRQSEADAAAGIAEEQGVEVPQPVVAAEAAGLAEAHVETAPPAEEAEAVAVGQETEAYDVLSEEQVAEHAAAPDAPAEEAEAASTEQPAEDAAAEGAAEAAEAPAAEDERQSLLAPSTPAAARAAAPLPPLPPLDTSEFQAANRPATPPIPDYYLTGEHTSASGSFDAIEREDEGRRSRVPFAVAGVLVAIFAVVLIATQIGGSSDNSNANAAKDKAAQRAARDNQTSTGKRNPEINRPAVNISVLNGTPTSGLAKVVSDQLNQAGFTSTTTGNRNDGIKHATSTVYYSPGNKLEAQEVAKELKIKQVKEADENTLAAGGSVPVIVVLGADIEQ
ncbi:MAG: LytR C-terminal domain-containing protein [Solirubrobacterales bacterium]